VALSFAMLHPLVLLLNKTPKFRLMDLVYPVHSPSQPLENTIGAIAVYLIAMVVATSYMRVQLHRRLWKAFHFSIYIAAAALFWHGIFTDPDLKNSRVDWLDGGKVFVEACAMVIAVIGFLRWRYSRRKKFRLGSHAISHTEVH
jgi:predicted ferric reductase